MMGDERDVKGLVFFVVGVEGVVLSAGELGDVLNADGETRWTRSRASRSSLSEC